MFGSEIKQLLFSLPPPPPHYTPPPIISKKLSFTMMMNFVMIRSSYSVDVIHKEHFTETNFIIRIIVICGRV
jgi:hypothetical protein